MHFLTKVSREEPEPLPPTDWEGGYFCQHVAVFVLFYFSCMVIVLASYSSFLQIYNAARTVVKSCRKIQSVECKSSAPQGFSLLCLAAALKRRVGGMLGAVFGQGNDAKAHRRVRYSLERKVPLAKKQAKHMRPGRHYKRHRAQHLHSSSGEILCYLPRKMLSYPYANEASMDTFQYGDFNFVNVWKSRYSKSGYRYIQSGREQGLKSASIASFENRLKVRPKLRLPFCGYKRTHFF
ncbi:uncharacterized protein LOC144694108 [Cetorhinus maximus]